MGFTYRQSVRVGPFRINLSKSGVGLSTGIPGFRIGQSSSGRRYTTFSVPGTGVSYRTTSATPKKNGCIPIIVLIGTSAATLYSVFNHLV